MFSNEVKNLLVQVVSSWQVLAVTVVLVIYISLVNYVARLYNRRSRPSAVPKMKKIKPKKAKEPDDQDVVVTDEMGGAEE